MDKKCNCKHCCNQDECSCSYLYSMQDYLSMRGVINPCPRCSGLGVRSYGSTSTWRGGPGGQMVTKDICNSCWGSGDAKNHWLNLKK